MKTRSTLNFSNVICALFITFQVHGRCKKNNISGSKHYLTVASGVMMSVFVSPVIAAVTVGKEHIIVMLHFLSCKPERKFKGQNIVVVDLVL